MHYKFTSKLLKFIEYQKSHQINSQAKELLANNSYNELGQLTSKKVGGLFPSSGGVPAGGGGAAGGVPQAGWLQNINYSYNIRGWLTGINDAGNLQVGTDPKDLFGFKINYNTPATASTTPLFNGNIAETYWKTANDDLNRGYACQYDNLNRLKAAIYQKAGTATNAYNESLTYDKNGNILTLNRNGTSETATAIDNLAYAYEANTNKLTTVTDATTSLEGFKDGNKTGLDFTYDVNGNMTIDKNKGITLIAYNHLNLPTQITFSGTNRKINYLYNATGQKIRKIVTEGTTVTTTDYLGGYQYVNNILQYFSTTEGYVTYNPQTTVYNYAYQYKDHLGNVRLSYTDGNKDGFISTTEIIEENNYYPFGLKQAGYNNNLSAFASTAQRIKYNGKELQDELGLNMYDYGARNYDPTIGRWMNVDPLAEKFYPLSGYSYVANSPILLGDPNGEDWTIIKNEDKHGRVHYQVTYTGAVLNSSSNKKIDMVGFAKAIVSQTENLLTSFEKRDDGSFDSAFTVDVQLRIVNDKKDVKDDESLIEIKDGSDKDFKIKDPTKTVVGKATNGKEISVNANEVNDIISGKNKKTIPHELGHTLGLKHPLMDTRFYGLIKGPTYNSPISNFMYQGPVKSPTGPTREQINRIYQLYTNNQLNRKDVQPVHSD